MKTYHFSSKFSAICEIFYIPGIGIQIEIDNSKRKHKNVVQYDSIYNL